MIRNGKRKSEKGFLAGKVRVYATKVQEGREKRVFPEYLMMRAMKKMKGDYYVTL